MPAPAPPLAAASLALPTTAADTRVRVLSWLREFLPGRMAVNARERWRVSIGALLGVLFTGLLCRSLVSPASALPWLMAPLGASTVLVFGVPASPLAQPWAVVGGNTISALAGIAAVHLLGGGPLAGAAAVALAIGLMFALRCLHPPGGACALLMVVGAVQDPQFALFPVFTNSLLLVAAGVIYNRATGRRYPHGQRATAPAAARHSAPAFSEADLDAVLARYNQVLDVPRDDLESLLAQAGQQAYQRRLGATRCGEAMSHDPLHVEYGTSLQDAWTLLRRHRIKALPVVDRARRIVGIVTLNDFMRGAELDLHTGWAERLRALVRPSGLVHNDKPEVVGQIMTRQVRVASAERPLAELVPLFADTGHHHIPVIDGEQRLVGILTQSDLVRALTRGG